MFKSTIQQGAFFQRVYMIPLETNRWVLTWLCVFPPERYTSKWKKLAHVAFSLAIFFINAGSFFGSLAFFLKYMSVDLEQCIFALVQMIGEVNMSYVSIITFIQRDKIKATYDNLSKIYRAHANQDSFRFLAHANNQSEMWWSILLRKLFHLGLFSIIISAILTTILSLMTEGKYVTEISYHSYKSTLPWDQMTLMGYTGEIVYDILLSFAYAAAGSFMLFFVALCQHHHAFYKIFQHSLRKLDYPHNQDSERLLCDLIRFHVSVKDLFEESAQVLSRFIMVQLISAMLMLSGSVFQIDLQIHHPNFDASMILLTTWVSTMLLFVYCYFGKIATDSFLAMSDCLFESNWPSLPVHLQKYFIIMITNAQRKLYYHGFGILFLNLETFSSLFKTVFTYYMVFKTITE